MIPRWRYWLVLILVAFLVPFAHLMWDSLWHYLAMGVFAGTYSVLFNPYKMRVVEVPKGYTK